jgi:hypothetical protein
MTLGAVIAVCKRIASHNLRGRGSGRNTGTQ